MNQKIVVIGLSGGVDSSVAALLLKKQGYKVIGAFMKNFSDTKNPLTNECSWVEEKIMAQKIANILKIPLVTFDFEKEYKKIVLEKMFKDYSNGLTPNPDIDCNTIIKFPLFWKKAKAIGADYIAMGHYARIKKSNLGYNLLKGKDEKKDQSYFLYGLSQEDLSHTLFPLGNFKKSQIREIAKKNKFPNWDKKSTRGICFVGKTNIKSFLEKKIKNKTGKIISPEKEILGYHKGIYYYTTGQRIGTKEGLEKQTSQKMYVAEKLKNNSLIVVQKNHPLLKKQKIIIKNLHIINKKEKFLNENIKVRIRHLGSFLPGKLKIKKRKFVFYLSKPEIGIAEGQSIVLYKKEIVLGGGEIRLK